MGMPALQHHRRGWTFVELMVVLVLVTVALLIGTLSVYRGKSAADQLTCQDNMHAIQSALQVYYLKNNRTYPADQAAFEAFLQSRTYFGASSAASATADELRCPLDENHAYHYLYSRNPTTGVITITCPVPDSGHGSY
jgi:prepilin-type N-terminal cleavage/methylation domain-containing protein